MVTAKQGFDENVAANRTQVDGYDANIIPSEVAKRQQREGDSYKQIPQPTSTEEDADLDTTGGYTISREGLLNNYAVEPEMYYEERGDRAAIIDQEKQERQQQLSEINETDEDGKLTPGTDNRGQGAGLF